MWKQYWPVYERLEQELCALTFFIALDDCQLSAYSLKLSELILRICSECENAAKTLASQPGFLAPTGTNLQRLNFPKLGDILCQSTAFNKVSVEVIWPYQTLTNNCILPLSTWSASNSSNPIWYDAYNLIKHDRNAHKASGNYENSINALAALFVLNLWLRKDEIEAKREWIEFQRKRILSYSAFFSPESFLTLGSGGVNKKLKLG